MTNNSFSPYFYKIKASLTFSKHKPYKYKSKEEKY